MANVSSFTPEIGDKICARIAEGESVRSIGRDESMPVASTIFLWLRTHEEFKKQYIIAKNESADALVEDALDIADNQVSQPLIIEGVPIMDKYGDLVMVKDAVSVNHARLRVDIRKWTASKLKPKKYGDKVQSEISGPDGGPVKIQNEWAILPVSVKPHGKDSD